MSILYRNVRFVLKTKNPIDVERVERNTLVPVQSNWVHVEESKDIISYNSEYAC